MDQKQKDFSVVESALDWAYRNGYVDGEKAGEAYARLVDRQMKHRDLGMWGDGLEFVPRDPEDVKHESPS